MIERRSIVLTSVVLGMLFTGMVLYLFTSGGLKQAKVAMNDDFDLELEQEITEELEVMDALEKLEEEMSKSTYAAALRQAQDETVAGVTLRPFDSTQGEQAQGEQTQGEEEDVEDVVPTAATGVKGYVVMAAGLAMLMGLIGLITAWRKSSGRQVEL